LWAKAGGSIAALQNYLPSGRIMSGTALIFGISGQDGSLLAKHLLTQGWTVHGTSRDAELNEFANLTRLGIRNSVTAHSANPIDFRSVIQVIERTAPDHVYNLGGQSSVGLSFEQPIETYESIVVATLNILESIRFLKRSIRFYNAASSECFGDTKLAADETTSFHPRSPYAVAKSAAFWAVANYRDAYGLFAASGILFNHESPLRPARFVTQKVIRAATDIANKRRTEPLVLGNLDVWRDWGWAEEYVEAMHLILRQDGPRDFVVATGQSESLKAFVAEAFAAFGLDWRPHVISSGEFMRPSDISVSTGCPDLAQRILGWKAQVRMPEVVRRLASAAVSPATSEEEARTSRRSLRRP
jgi:GDPmannose 4,6-dehydratase